MSSDYESDSEHQEFVQNFFNLVQDINKCSLYLSYQRLPNSGIEKQNCQIHKKCQSAKKQLLLNSLILEAGQINFKMPQSLDQNVSEIVSFNKNQAEKLVKPMRNQTKNLENSQVEPFICNVHQILRDIKLKQQILRNVQKQVYLNLIEHHNKKPSKVSLRTSCLHVYLAEKIYADKIKDAAINQTIHETPHIVIPLFKNILQTRKGSMD
ncbi:unnamed protein product (macronuclear) [Paramecium tetraurelia]|uniref:Uncharacterized protein n=1 Tax=Paramecium tetraurelia TaxID=5888 RepID=A0DTM6_PARTE|nr:uncharacterized protein GSPATT00020074001 [Paramecium tetraurelia]CAK86393.1 unnamed protein product [Paramecium tetraurelia]|eukprot:XP_001453790.1 hypothetical protein (macronuclear) [Paramecium tetraurelia strain d4-2]